MTGFPPSRWFFTDSFDRAGPSVPGIEGLNEAWNETLDRNTLQPVKPAPGGGWPDARRPVDVSREEFEAFVAAYPRPLKRHFVGFTTPDMTQLLDWSLGNLDAALVADFRNYSLGPGEGWDVVNAPCEFRIWR